MEIHDNLLLLKEIKFLIEKELSNFSKDIKMFQREEKEKLAVAYVEKLKDEDNSTPHKSITAKMIKTKIDLGEFESLSNQNKITLIEKVIEYFKDKNGDDSEPWTFIFKETDEQFVNQYRISLLLPCLFNLRKLLRQKSSNTEECSNNEELDKLILDGCIKTITNFDRNEKKGITFCFNLNDNIDDKGKKIRIEKHTHAFLDYWGLKCLCMFAADSASFTSLTKNDQNQQLLKVNDTINEIRECIQTNVLNQIAYSKAGLLEFNPNELAFWIAALKINNGFVNQRLTKKALEIIFKNMKRNGGWIQGKPIGYSRYSSATYNLYEMEPLDVLLENFSDDGELFPFIDKIYPAFKWLTYNRIEIKNNLSNIADQKFPGGWAFTHHGGRDPRSWVTAIVYSIFHNFRILINKRIIDLVLKKYNALYKHSLRSKVEEYVYSTNTLEDVLNTIVGEIQAGDYPFILIFGPPGTGKSSVQNIIPCKVEKPLISLCPSDFLINGDRMVCSTIKTILDDISLLEDAIVYIDEIDDFVRKREIVRKVKGNSYGEEEVQESTLEERFITLTMLSELSKLRGNKKLCLIASTNCIDKVDDAFLRKGRFDVIIGIGPFDKEERKDFIMKKMKGSNTISKENLEAIVENTKHFVYGELKDLIDNSWNKKLPVGQLDNKKLNEQVSSFLEVIKNYKQNIKEKDYVDFVRELKEYDNTNRCDKIYLE